MNSCSNLPDRSYSNRNLILSRNVLMKVKEQLLPLLLKMGINSIHMVSQLIELGRQKSNIHTN